MLNRAVIVLSLFVFVSGCGGFGRTSGVPAGQHDTMVEFAKSDAGPYQDLMKRAGYLSAEAIPDSAILLPAPPAEGTEAMAYDEAVNRQYMTLRDSPRWNQASKDAELTFPEAFEAFSCILNVPITEEATPGLYKLLRRVALDAGKSTRGAKEKYKRPRPFLVNHEPICTPEEQGTLMFNGSYPSGHSAVGWAWALVLAELSPEQSEAVLARGRDFGESRLICNVHWQSDVVEGRFMAACAVARLHGESAFRADMETARVEIQTALEKGLKPLCN
jgi:acid phosphatase (class A)